MGTVLMVAVSVFFTAALMAGCTTTVSPPLQVSDPVTVYIVDHGHTPSLLLPAPEGGAVRYAYGDWIYYAKGDRHPLWHGAPALLWSTPAAVGRQPLPRMPLGEATAVEFATSIPVYELHGLEVERADAVALYQSLEDHFGRQWENRLENPSAALTFVPHPDNYNLAHDSNRMVARWLQQMGAQTQGPFWAVNWRVRPE